MKKDKKIWVVVAQIVFSVYTNKKEEVLKLIGNTFKKKDKNVDLQSNVVLSITENKKQLIKLKKIFSKGVNISEKKLFGKK